MNNKVLFIIFLMSAFSIFAVFLLIDNNGPFLYKMKKMLIQDYKPKIVCHILSMPKYKHTKLEAVLSTWAKRCYQTHVFYAKNQTKGGTVVAQNLREGKKHLTKRIFRALEYSYGIHGDSVDWYLKGDDDTYFIMENLQYLLSTLDPDKAYYVGKMLFHEPDIAKEGYHSGGAGYVLSRAAVRRFVKHGHRKCIQRGTIEDADMGACMTLLGAIFLNGEDDSGKDSFVLGKMKSKIRKEAHMPSRSSISFHKVKPRQMYTYDFLIYTLCVWKISNCKPETYSMNSLTKYRKLSDMLKVK